MKSLLSAFCAAWLLLGGSVAWSQEQLAMSVIPAFTKVEIERACKSALIKPLDGSKIIVSGPNSIILEGGSVVVYATRDTHVVCNRAIISMKPNSVVCVSHDADATTIRNIHDGQLNSVQASVDGYGFSLAIDQEVVVSDDFTTLHDSVSKDQVGRRHPTIFTLPHGNALLICEFDPVSFFRNSQLMRSIFLASGPQKALGRRLMKTTASSMTATVSHGRYAYIE
jgi:hypothetical protein